MFVIWTHVLALINKNIKQKKKKKKIYLYICDCVCVYSCIKIQLKCSITFHLRSYHPALLKLLKYFLGFIFVFTNGIGFN